MGLNLRTLKLKFLLPLVCSELTPLDLTLGDLVY
jgi:hypothetical protein